jgi:2-haloalkanoic acid dehalogenase type II
MLRRPLRLQDTQVITFDCYGTLIDWEGGAQQTLRELLARKGARTDEAAFFAEWERAQWSRIQKDYAPYRDIAAEAFAQVAVVHRLPLDADDARAFADSVGAWKPFPDTVEALRALKRHVRLGIVSNIDDDLLAATLRQLGVAFDPLTTAQQARAYKPSPVPFQHALEKLGLPPELVAHAAFGFEYDIGPAAALGMRTILVRRSRSEFPGSPVPDLIVADLAELAAQFA